MSFRNSQETKKYSILQGLETSQAIWKLWDGPWCPSWTDFRLDSSCSHYDERSSIYNDESPLGGLLGGILCDKPELGSLIWLISGIFLVVRGNSKDETLKGKEERVISFRESSSKPDSNSSTMTQDCGCMFTQPLFSLWGISFEQGKIEFPPKQTHCSQGKPTQVEPWGTHLKSGKPRAQFT